MLIFQEYNSGILCKFTVPKRSSVHKQSSVPQKNRQTIAKSYAFCSFCTRLLLKHEFPDAKAKLKALCQNEALCIKTAACPRIRYNPESAVLCLCKEKRSFFNKPRLQRLPKQSSVHKQSSVPQKNRQTIAKSYAFCSFCTRLLLKHEFPDAKAKLPVFTLKNPSFNLAPFKPHFKIPHTQNIYSYPIFTTIKDYYYRIFVFNFLFFQAVFLLVEFRHLCMDKMVYNMALNNPHSLPFHIDYNNNLGIIL